MYKEDGTQILRLRKNILYTTLHVTSFFDHEWRDVRIHKSRLKYEIKFELYYKLHNQQKTWKPKIFTFEDILKNVKT